MELTVADERYQEFKSAAMRRKSRYYCHPEYDMPAEGKMKIRGTGHAFITDEFNRPTIGQHCIFVVELQGEPEVEVACFIYPAGIQTTKQKGRDALSDLKHMYEAAMEDPQDCPFGLRGSYRSEAQLTFNHLREQQTKPNESCVFHKHKWDKDANILAVDPHLRAELTLSEEQRQAVAALLTRLKCATHLTVNLSVDVNLSMFSEACPKSCLPGLLTLCDSVEGKQYSYPDATLIMPAFAVFTNTGFRKHELAHQPMVEFLILINQLFSVTYITQPAMLFKLVAVSLDKPLSELAADKNLRSTLKSIEKLRHIFFVSKFNFIRFEETTKKALKNIPLESALDHLLCF